MRPFEVVSEQRLMSAGWVTDQAVQAGSAIKYVSSEFPKGYRHPEKDWVKGVGVPVETTPHLEEVRAALEKHLEPRCTVNGKPVAELAVLIKPVAFLVTTGNGTHEVGRCYYQNDAFSVGPDTKRIGGIGLERVEYFPERGLFIHLEHGYELFAPAAHCQATWRRTVSQ